MQLHSQGCQNRTGLDMYRMIRSNRDSFVSTVSPPFFPVDRVDSHAAGTKIPTSWVAPFTGAWLNLAWFSSHHNK